MPSKRPQRSSPNANAVDQLDFAWLAAERRRRLYEDRDYFAVYRIGKTMHEFVANVLARDEADAVNIAKRQIYFRPVQGRTYLRSTHIGLSGYAAALLKANFQK